MSPISHSALARALSDKALRDLRRACQSEERRRKRIATLNSTWLCDAGLEAALEATLKMMGKESK